MKLNSAALAAVSLFLFPSLALAAESPALSFPHLEPRIDALNITNVAEVQSLIVDWQASIDALPAEPEGNKVNGKKSLSMEKELELVKRQFSCPVNAPTYCTWNFYDFCCGGSQTCCYTNWCCNVGATCCNSNPGLCCPAGKFCCSLTSCCFNGQICNNGVCSDPPPTFVTVTVVVTTTRVQTIFTTVNNAVTSTIQQNVVQTSVVTVNSIATATSVIFITQTKTITAGGAKRTAEPAQEIIPAPTPAVHIGLNPRLDDLAAKLERKGLIVDRAVSTIYATATSTVNSFVTSVVYQGNTVYLTQFATQVITSTTFLNAQTTITQTSTIILTVTVQAGGGTTITGSISTQGGGTTTQGAGAGTTIAGNGKASSSTITTTDTRGKTITLTQAAATNSQTSLGGAIVKKGGLSTGAKAGIGIGAVVAAALIGTLLFLLFALWKKNKKHEEEEAIAAGNAPSNLDSVSPPPPGEYYQPVPVNKAAEMAAVGVIAGAGTSPGRDSTQPSYAGTTVSAASPTNSGQWSPPPQQSPTQGTVYPAPTNFPGYPHYQPNPTSPPPAAVGAIGGERMDGRAEMPSHGATMNGPQELDSHGYYHQNPTEYQNPTGGVPWEDDGRGRYEMGGSRQ